MREHLPLAGGVSLGAVLEEIGEGSLIRVGTGFRPQRVALLGIQQFAVLPLLVELLHVGMRDQMFDPIVSHKQAFGPDGGTHSGYKKAQAGMNYDGGLP